MKPTLTIRCVLAATFLLGIWAAGTRSSLGVEIPVELIPVLDQFGSQIETVQIYEDASGQRVSYSIYDTGASVITWSAYDQAFHVDFPEYAGPPIPIKVFDGAEAEGIGGSLTGDVSQPGTIRAAGIEGLQFDADFNMTFNLENGAFVPGDPVAEHGVQMFVGTETGSPYLSTITGTPIHNGRLSSNPTGPNGVAAKIDMQWDQFDLGALLGSFDKQWGELFQGITLTQPNVEFVAPGTKLEAIPDDLQTTLVDESTTDPVRIPLAMFGEDNHQNPGDMITSWYNPFQNTGVVLSEATATIGDDPNRRLAMLFDTGAQLSIISKQMARDLGFDPETLTPEFSMEVQGAAGGIGRIPGFTIDSLELPVDDDDVEGPDGKVIFTNVPVFVYDVTPADTDPEEGLDGILGMNLFNTASGLLYDPFDPRGASLSVTFLRNPYREDFDAEALAAFQAPFSSPGGLDVDLADLDSLAGEALLGLLEALELLEELGVDLSLLDSTNLETFVDWPDELGELGLELTDLDSVNLGEATDWLDTLGELEGLGLSFSELDSMNADSFRVWLDDLMVSAEQANHISYPRFLVPIDGSNVPGSWTGATIPEPSTWVLLATGGVLLLCWRLRRRRAA